MARVILKEKKTPNKVSKNRWDDWVPQDRVRKLTPENRELAAQLHNQMKKNLQESKGPKSTGKGGKGGRTNGSDFGSGRGSEERGSAAVQGGRVRRGPRDYDLEHVSVVFFIVMCFGLVCASLLVVSSGRFTAETEPRSPKSLTSCFYGTIKSTNTSNYIKHRYKQHIASRNDRLR